MVRFGVIGTGWITDEFIRCATLTGDFVLQAVYSRTEERAREFARKHAVHNIFTDLADMAHSAMIDAVYIASPNACHASQAILFMRNRKHVLCEKPIASNVRELTEMIRAARGNKVVLMEAVKTTFLPNFQSVKENLPKIGKIRRFFSNYCQYSSRYDSFKQGNTANIFSPLFSGGSLMDLGVYCIYPAVYLFGSPQTVQASAVLLESGVDGEGSICLTYGDMDAIIVHSKITHSALPSEIQGENGNIIIDRISAPEKVEIVYRNGLTENITRPQAKEHMYYEIREFIDLVKHNRRESAVNSHRLSLAVMEIMEIARKQFGLVFPADTNEEFLVLQKPSGLDNDG